MRLARVLPFTMVENEFQRLHRPLSPLTIDGMSLSPSLPARRLAPPELRAVLLERSTSYETRNAALGWLLVRAQTDGGAWILASTGMVLPGLRARTSAMTHQSRPWAAEAQAAVLEAAVEAVLRVPPSSSKIASKIVWAGFRGGCRFATDEQHAPPPCGSREAGLPGSPGGHPDLVLQRAVREGVIRERDAAIVGDSRLGGAALSELAAADGLGYYCVSKRRHRAELRLAAWLEDEAA